MVQNFAEIGHNCLLLLQNMIDQPYPKATAEQTVQVMRGNSGQSLPSCPAFKPQLYTSFRVKNTEW